MAKAPNTILPWYKKEIGPRLKPDTRKFFESYSNIENDQLEKHLHRIRDEAWSIETYPCVGQWEWLTSTTHLLPNYLAILQRLQASDSILDLGCCFGQDLRRLAADGAPTDKMYASDLPNNFWELSYDLYQDKEKFKAIFIEADIFDPDSKLHSLKGTMDIVFINRFLHLWNREKQIEVVKTIVSLTKPGAWIVGTQTGSHLGKEFPFQVNKEGESEDGSSFFMHNAETYEKLWKQVGEEMGISLSVTATECSLDEWMEPEDQAWMDKSMLGLKFNVCRLDGPE